MRALGLVLMLLVCGPTSAFQPSEGETPINLVEELEDPDFEATTGINMRSVRTALAGDELKRLDQLTSKATADIASAQETKSHEEAMPPGADQPVDVMRFSQPNLNSRQPRSAHDAKAARQSARLEAESDKSSKLPTVANMNRDIQDSIRSSMSAHTKSVPKASRTWDSVFPSESDLKRPSSGMAQGQIQAEVATAEKEQLLNREHAVANAEQNLSYLEHQAHRKVRMAERQAQASESDQLDKVQGKEEHAERDEAKARTDEAGAVKLKQQEDTEMGKLRVEVHSLRQKLGKAGADRKMEKLQVQVDTDKAVNKVKIAVQQQSHADKEAAQSELSTLKVSAQDVTSKLHAEETTEKLQQRENIKLRKQLEGDESFTATEVKHAVAKAHLVSETLWQGKVSSLSKELVDSQTLSQEKADAASQATEAWAKVAHKLNSRLQEQASAQTILTEAQAGIAGQQRKALVMHQLLKREKMATQVAKASLDIKDKQLADMSAKKAAAHQEVKRLESNQAVMTKKEQELELRTQALNEQLQDKADRLEKAEAKLKVIAQDENAKGPAAFASTKDFLDIISGEQGGGSDHLLPQVLNTNLNAKP